MVYYGRDVAKCFSQLWGSCVSTFVQTCILQRWRKTFEMRGGELFVCVCKHAHSRGVWEYAPPEKFCQLDVLRVLLRPLLAQSGTAVIVVICVSLYVVQRVQTSEFPVLSTI